MNSPCLLRHVFGVRFVTLAALVVPSLGFAQTLENGVVRFGNGSQDSINEFGNLLQPFYYSQARSQFYKLTYSNYPLDVQFGAGSGSHWTNSAISVNPVLSDQVIDSSGYIPDGSDGGHGTVTSTGNVTIGGHTLQLTQAYTLGTSDAFVSITTSVTNNTDSTIPNAHMWVGTRDDWVGTSDGPTKVKGVIVDGAFEAITDPTTPAPALQITSGDEGVLFYSVTPGTNTIIARCCSFTNATTLQPTQSVISDTADGSYALYLPIGDIAPGETAEIVWFYAAGSLEDLEEVVQQVAAAASPTSIAAINANNPSPILSGTYDDTVRSGVGHALLTVTVGGTTYTEGVDDALVVADGEWSLDLSAVSVILQEGTYDVVVQATDTDGESVVDGTSDEIVIDMTAPQAPTIDPLATNGETLVMQGSFDETDASGGLSVTLNGTTYVLGEDDELTADGSRWSLNVDAPDVEGFYDVEVSVTDQAGNVVTDTSDDELEIDLTAPDAPTINAIDTNQAATELSGTWDSENSASLTVTINGETYDLDSDDRLTVDGDQWFLDMEGLDLPDGEHDVVISVIDDAGNVATDDTTNEIRIDLSAPSAPTVNPATTNADSPEITGTYDASETDSVLTVTVDGTSFTLGIDAALTAVEGDWTLVIPTIDGGTYDVDARLEDAVGNGTSDLTDAELTVDRVAPEAPTVAPVASSESPSVISGTLDSEDFASFSVTVGGEGGVTLVYGVDDALTLFGDTWTVDLSEVELPEGVHDVQVTVTDAAGNVVTDATTGEIEIDQTAPMSPTIDDILVNASPDSVGGQFDASDSASLSVVVNGREYVLGVDPELSADGNEWQLDLTGAEFEEGIYDVQVSVTDSVGNVATDESSDEIVVDQTAPEAPTVSAVEDDTGAPTLTGTYDPADIGEDGLRVTIDGQTFTMNQDESFVVADGVWTLSLSEGTLADGTYDVLVEVTDAAGNTATDATVDEIVVFVDADRDGISDADELELGTNPDSEDSDGDGISDFDEIETHGTSPFSDDSDGDGISDVDELAEGYDPNAPDSDGDGLSDAQELELGTNPMSADTDGDGLSDFEEIAIYETRPGVADTDGDGISDFDELTHGTRPTVADTDGDGLSDGFEVTLDLNALATDSDADGLPDATEVAGGVTEADAFDTDEDGFGDAFEIANGTDPNDASDVPEAGVDTDDDGISDILERYLGTNPELADTDGDGLLDGHELDLGTNPRSVDTDGDGLADGAEVDAGTEPLAFDTDGDGLSDGLEALIGTDATVQDTDEDGLLDGAEVRWVGTDPLVADTDGDALNDGTEVFDAITDPTAWDTDRDGLADGNEYEGTTAPLRFDTDGGSVGDGAEFYAETDAMFPPDDEDGVDTDGDGLSDALETALGWDPSSDDSDGDGLLDGDEMAIGSNGMLADSDGDGMTDTQEIAAGTGVLTADSDGDGLSDGQELELGTDPQSRDTDRDGLEDGIESTGPTDVVIYDTDRDGLSDSEERQLGTDPLNADTDGDGRLDGIEDSVGSDPLIADTDSEDLDGDGLSGIEEEALGTDPLVADTDGDGVDDGSDWCPLDSPDDVDGDGVCNSDDMCPADANDDSDGDGSCDSVDRCEGNDRFGDVDLDGFCDDTDECISTDAPGKAPCFVDDQGGCTFSTTGGTAPFGLGFITLGLLAIRRRRNS